MNIAKDCLLIRLQLLLIDGLEVIIRLISYLIEYVLQAETQKQLAKHILCKCECKFDSVKCNSNQKWNSNKYRCECKNPKEHNVCQKGYNWNPATCNCKNGRYAGSTIDDSAIMCDKIIDAVAKLYRYATKILPQKPFQHKPF